MPSWPFILLLAIWLHFCCAHEELLHVRKCSDHHHTIIKGENLFQQHVPYKNHPYDKSNHTRTHYSEGEQTDNIKRRRRALSDSETAPIRVSAYYDPTSITNGLTSTQQEHIEQLVGAIASYYEQFVKVVPIDGTFFIDRRCSRGNGY